MKIKQKVQLNELLQRTPLSYDPSKALDLIPIPNYSLSLLNKATKVLLTVLNL